MNSMVLGELIRAQMGRELAFTHDEITAAYKAVSEEEQRLETMTETTTVEETTTTVTTTVTTTKPSETTTTAPKTSDTEPPTSFDTLRTTQKTHEYTTYSGIKWWEITGNSNTGTDGFEDWFAQDEEDIPQETVTAGTSAPLN